MVVSLIRKGIFHDDFHFVGSGIDNEDFGRFVALVDSIVDRVHYFNDRVAGFHLEDIAVDVDHSQLAFQEHAGVDDGVVVLWKFGVGWDRHLDNRDFRLSGRVGRERVSIPGEIRFCDEFGDGIAGGRFFFSAGEK